MKSAILTIAVLGIGVGLAQAASHSQTPASVKARHGIMQNYSYSLGTLGDMAKGEAEYDAELAQAAADRLVALSAIPQTGYWVEGTSSEDLDDSRALPAIWENMDDYLSGFDELNEAAVSMAAVASDGQEALGPQMQAIGQSCGGCHEDYRMSND
ncbi:Cytochrome c-554 [Rhodobacteraceae bacterium THAF1]|uniref:c-type cytochrome n=1 Tax=Palleronia sp. THAF1 TaxID=2587842 RepID=UPI000F40D2FF|nr:cytochrome c [Palleronia sp. THAF1]QFU08585.1 Cytochrome c-554 [Palleronia sp. THAF1]VDC30667.1 Cytochrome c-554 [Rhodobacteraceae bacterium THAF1]